MSYLTRTAALLALLLAPLARADWEIHVDWEILGGTQHMGRISTLQSDGERLYAGADNGVYLSDDDGHTWRLTLPGGISTIAIDTDSVYTFVSQGIRHGCYRSDDQGETWTPIHGSLPKRTSSVRRFPLIEQLLPTSSGTLIAAAYYAGVYISHDRGETWKDVFDDWVIPRDRPSDLDDTYVAHRNTAMTEFDGYWWISTPERIYRSPDNGNSWEAAHPIDNFLGSYQHWAAVGGQLYLAVHEGVTRWNETEGALEYVDQGLPPGFLHYPETLGVHDNRLFVGLEERGVYMYDEHFNRWIASGLDGLDVNWLVSHNSELYAVTSVPGFPGTLAIFRGSMLSVRPYSKAITTWGAIKQK